MMLDRIRAVEALHPLSTPGSNWLVPSRNRVEYRLERRHRNPAFGRPGRPAGFEGAARERARGRPVIAQRAVAVDVGDLVPAGRPRRLGLPRTPPSWSAPLGNVANPEIRRAVAIG